MERKLYCEAQPLQTLSPSQEPQSEQHFQQSKVLLGSFWRKLRTSEEEEEEKEEDSEEDDDDDVGVGE